MIRRPRTSTRTSPVKDSKIDNLYRGAPSLKDYFDLQYAEYQLEYTSEVSELCAVALMD